MKTFYVTFSKNSNLRKQVVKVSAMDHKDAIRTTKEIYGNDWETIYTEKEYKQLNDNGGIEMNRFGISLVTLYDKFGEKLEYGTIKKARDGICDYYDFYKSDGFVACMDGEICKVIKKNEKFYILQSVEEESVTFKLSLDEARVATFDISL